MKIKQTKNPNEYITYEDHVEFIINSEKYGKFNVSIDIQDYKRVKKYRWSVSKVKNPECESYKMFYAHNKKAGLLHRYILHAPKNKLVDHIDGDTMNNRKCNLRMCDRNQNAKNRKRSNINTSGHKGVCLVTYPSGLQRWHAYACHKDERYNLGYYVNILDAIKAREKFEDEYYQEFNRKDIDYDLIERNINTTASEDQGNT
jgi:hypothetical protein